MNDLPTSDLGAPDEAEGAADARHAAVSRRAGAVPRAADSRRAAPDLAPGSLFAGRFVIVGQIGEGGMGEVYKAIDTRLDGPVALKMIRASVARQAGSVERFKDEVRIARQISHRSVCRVHDLGDLDGQVYLSMEWIQGETLRQLLRRAGSLETDRALAIAVEIAGALDAAQLHGVIHRDLKPENVMIDERGDVHVMDFGIAVLEESQGRASAAGPLGTPGYMAPEQKRGEPLDARADLYALGVILVEMMTGELPVNPYDALARLRHGAARGLAPLVQSLIEPVRERRAASAASVADALRASRQPTGGIRRWRRAAAWTAVAAVVIAAGMFVARARRARAPGPPTSVYASSPGWVYYQRGAVYWKNLGDAETMLKRSAEARQAYLRARDLARARANATPLDPQAHRQLAILCAKTRDDACALKEGTRATELAPGDASIAFANAVIRCLLGRHDEALELLERAARLGYARDDIENDPDLRPLHDLPRYRRIVELAG
jgi:tetratricopeptide (TPR) repeat protein